jgi:hypothetical protein
MTSFILSLFLILAPATAEPQAGRMKTVSLDQEFEIGFGQQVLIEGEGLRITFTRVAEDSRCPRGVNCIWAGNGKVVLKLTKMRRRPALMSLNTTLDPKQDDYRGYDVKLVSLSPDPQKDVPIKRSRYAATLVVSRK